MERLLGSHDGIGVFQSLVHSVRQGMAVLA
jgi:hypothetical protein